MTYPHCWYAYRHAAVVAALALVLAGLVGCAAGPATRSGEAAPQTMTSVTSAAPEHPCAEFACEP
jgi:hypothetical protein